MGILSVMLRPSEFMALLRLKKQIGVWKKRSASQKKDADWEFCFDMLNKVSRSFAIVIEQLGDELRNAICVFYLVLRGLDTVEDDMALDHALKTRLLLNFHEAIEEEGWDLSCGYKDEKYLIENFDRVVRAYRSLKPQYRDTIKDITRRMAEGMQKFTETKVVKIADYDLYCHYVAGLVGIGLSQLFSGSGLEDESVAQDEELSNHMGLFLQKTNIIRDFLEDHEDYNEETDTRRVFWPKQIWGKYTDDLANFTFGKNETQAVACLNHMVTDALRHLPHSIEYLSSISDEQNFLFCAIPQVMAAHTLSLCYANPDIFKGQIRKNLGECRNTRPVKIRKGLSAKLMLETTDMQATLNILEDAVEMLADKIVPTDPSAQETIEKVQLVRELIAQGRRSSSPSAKEAPTWKQETSKVTTYVADQCTLPLLSLLFAITAAVDVPQAMGNAWWSSEAVPTDMGAAHVWITCLALLFYSASIAILSSSVALSWCNLLATMQFLLAIAEVACSPVLGFAVVAQALPKFLAAGLLPSASRTRYSRQLLSKQKAAMGTRVLRPRPLKAGKAY
jgi:farnesyl-diphosphate farnesyltransferase